MHVPCSYWATWTFVCSYVLLTALKPLKSEIYFLGVTDINATFLVKANASYKPKFSWRNRGEDTPAHVIGSSYMISFLISSFPSHLNRVYRKLMEAQQKLNLEKEGD